jgi:hypothetical protein
VKKPVALVVVIAVAILGLLAVTSGVGSAGTTINACVKKQNGQLRVVDTPAQCLPSETPIALQGPSTEPDQIGAWFGIARPCPPPAGDTSPEHAAFCTAVCGLCPSLPGALPPEIPLMTTLSADGTVMADDAGELGLYHTTAHGKWTVSEADGLPDRPGTQRFKATFLWLGQNFLGSNKLDNSVRPRFVTYFDPTDPDRMLGFIQPHFFTPFPPGFTTSFGIVNVIPASPADPLDSNHIPAVDPLVTLPPGCTIPPAGNCLGTYHFVIRRIQAQ